MNALSPIAAANMARTAATVAYAMGGDIGPAKPADRARQMQAEVDAIRAQMPPLGFRLPDGDEGASWREAASQRDYVRGLVL